MADEFLYSQLFNNASPPRLDKKDSSHDKKDASNDILNSLFQIEMPPAKKKDPLANKQKTHQD